MNAPSCGRDVAPHGRLLGTTGLPVGLHVNPISLLNFWKVSVHSFHQQSAIRFPFHSPSQKIKLNREVLQHATMHGGGGMHYSR